LALTRWHGFGILGKRRIVRRRIVIVCHGGAGMDARTRFSTRIVGGLPVVAAYLDEVGIGRIVDEVVPWEGDVPLGTLVEILIVNRLLEPKALYGIGSWAEKASVTDYYGLTADQLNDDRLGRALERIAEHGEAVQVPLVVSTIKKFRLKVNQVHYDISNAELYGAYERQLARLEGEEASGASPGVSLPKPAYGRTKSGRKNVKQIQFGLNVVRDGAVPVGHLALDGNAAEAPTHLENLRLLGRILPKRKRLYTADSKADTPETLLAIAASQGEFLCAGVFQPHLKKEYLRLRKKMEVVDYCPKSQAHLPPEERDEYQVAEQWDKAEGIVDGRSVCVKYRTIYVWSEAKARQEAKTRERHVAKIREEFETVERNLNKYRLKTEDAIVRRLETARSKYREGSLFAYELTKGRNGKFRLTWRIDEKARKEQEALEGAYVLKTNLPKKAYPAAEVLAEYKQQIHVERRIGDLKGPLAVTPTFLEKPERMAGLLYILVWSLMVLALMERAVRRNLKGKPMYGIYPENRPSPAPTGRSILACFADLCIVIMKEHGETQRRLCELSPVQQKLVRLLGIPPNRLRAFKRKCAGQPPPDAAHEKCSGGCGT
jgi:transposase